MICENFQSGRRESNPHRQFGRTLRSSRPVPAGLTSGVWPADSSQRHPGRSLFV